MRATNGASRHRMIKRMKARAKGYYSGRHKMYRVICEAVKRSEVQAYFGRKLKKRQFRQLWIARISIACRQQGINYSRLIHGLLKADIRLDRKQLSELAIHQPEAFNAVVAQAKAALAAKV
jgi:large subunit ribosomal protein L20